VRLKVDVTVCATPPRVSVVVKACVGTLPLVMESFGFWGLIASVPCPLPPSPKSDTSP
jgi:hypothetical protein